MCSTSLICQQSDDLSVYLPHDIDFQEALLFQSVEVLMQSIKFACRPAGHRTDVGAFNPMADDMEASSALSNDEPSGMNSEDYNDNDVCTYLYEPSSVVPHMPSLPHKSTMNVNPLSSPRSRNQSNMLPSSRMNVQKFMMFDNGTRRERRPLLHEFLRFLLDKREYAHIIEYVDRKQGVFKLHQPKDVSDLWKRVKGRNSDNNMTYDKLARAIRYYYPSRIMISSPGRFVFRFGPKSGFGTTWWPA